MSEQQNILRLRIKTSPESFLFLAGQSDATIFKKFAIKFTGRSNCRARKIKNNSNILSETASDKPCAGQALTMQWYAPILAMQCPILLQRHFDYARIMFSYNESSS